MQLNWSLILVDLFSKYSRESWNGNITEMCPFCSLIINQDEQNAITASECEGSVVYPINIRENLEKTCKEQPCPLRRISRERN